jgi:UDP-glucose 4-epimerase
MHVLVTGGAGFIGSTLLDRLLAGGHTATSVDDLSTGHLANVAHLEGHADMRLLELDLTRDDLDAAFADRPPAVVVHLAAQISVRRSVADAVRDAEINVLGTVRLLEAAQRHGVGKVVFTTSGGCIYGQPALADLPVTEDHPTEPHSPYGASKLTGELYLRTYARLHGLRWTSLALGNVYGPRQDPAGEAGVVAIFAEQMLAGAPCTIFGDGEQTRDFVHVDDVVDALVRALEDGDGVRINIGTGTRTSVNSLFERMATITGYDQAAVRRPGRTGELDHISVSPERAGRLLGWRPTVGLDEGLAGTIEWVRATPPRAPRTSGAPA